MFHKDFYPKPRITLLDAELSNKSKQQLNDLLDEFSDVMSENSKVIGLTHLEEMVLPTEPGAAPVASKPNDLHLRYHKFVKEELANLLEADLIERSLKSKLLRLSPKASIALIETAKNDHTWAKLKGVKYVSSLDIRSGYHHISIHPESRPKTAFICPCGKFRWKRVSYGITHAQVFSYPQCLNFSLTTWMILLYSMWMV